MNFIRHCDYCVDDPSLIALSEDAPLSALLWAETSELINLDHVAYISLGGSRDGDWRINFKLTGQITITWPYKIKEQAIAAYIKLVRTITG